MWFGPAGSKSGNRQLPCDAVFYYNLIVISLWLSLSTPLREGDISLGLQLTLGTLLHLSNLDDREAISVIQSTNEADDDVPFHH